MNGLGASVVGVSVIVLLVSAYGLGMPGCIGGGVVLLVAWVLSAALSWVDPGTFMVEGIVGALAVGLSLRWSLRHRAWRDRMSKDSKMWEERQLQLQGAVQQLRETLSIKGAEVDHALKQYEMVKKLAEALSWEEMSPSLERALKHFFHVEAWGLYLTNEKGELQLAQRRGIMPELQMEDLSKKEPYLQSFLIPVGPDQGKATWMLHLPLWRLHERIGHLTLRIPDFAPDTRATILSDAAGFSTQLIFAMAKAKLYRELDQRSRTDGLTGLSRRGPFEERLKEEVARAQSFRSTFSILMIDIDHFKRLNDTYGHQVGDEVLRTVSQRLKEGLYETDLIARYGGEEFVCLLPRSLPAGLKIKAERIRERIAEQAFVIGLEAIQVTISIGIAHFPQDATTGEGIMAAADHALYAAKGAGRNCVMEATPTA